jgi:hypothetical protein
MVKSFHAAVYSALNSATKSSRAYRDKLSAEEEERLRDEQEIFNIKDKAQKALELKVKELISSPKFFTVFDSYKRATRNAVKIELPERIGTCQTFYSPQENGTKHWTKTNYGVLILEKSLAMYLDTNQIDMGDQSASHQKLTASEFVNAVSSPKEDDSTMIIGLSHLDFQQNLQTLLVKIDKELKQKANR